MIYKRFGDTIVVRLNRGEEVLNQLKQVCEAESITAGSISGIGAADYAVVGLYEVEKQKYTSQTLKGEMEITSLLGNISRKEGALYLHLHASFANQEGRCLGGHLNEARISATCELFIRCLDGEIGRMVDKETGLNVFAF